ncbi:tRNA glutamyl-Q(34) synthetase GluQRS [Achromobacter ruhlandii]|uniref:Glutamyl-Q tRNA(Asp) synthetase n=1 Tax=Achromobacter ruhlandii TaxID=72557 RepID=A0ABM8LXY0_9BURK|nr:tRNA glutamyl-Q(34) synthetase GluQRS [Achromobacter ruhlandii]AKP87618.1 glutamyl-Q-tRNA synthetase [Achromobacter xylosoxidans]AOU90966.1 glutamyl-Q-tRNA synthetase [Achromobacter ruhlandii]MCZ8433929.1 tRNA glutamyl-Q(34) synthetase GluQRS [Achromobacter ruhlandii]MDC6089041.1 tRNA glutamyl-Q(34) synthetase GluQRS [Achromobacter ruhlandii]MDC6152322.1 tRNA glutamyl-Q(34) synthetase GluQRS [Achromobacter ruhlandii]
MTYTGRFAPSPSGPLHAGSLVAALASWLDARAHHGRWLLRIEDVDTPRTVPGAAETIMGQLEALGLRWDGDIVWQSQRGDAYQAAFDALAARGLVYGCGCTRREIADSALRGQAAPGADGERPYPGTCRHGLAPGREARAWRVIMPEGVERFEDRWLGPQEQDVARAVGDIAVKRADGLWAYQLAVVVDDGAQGVTDVVRGADLLSSTARQRVLGRLLGLPPVRYLHVPLILDPASGLKLSKQNGAPAIDTSAPLASLQGAWRALGFAPLDAPDTAAFLREATARWAARFPLP